MFKFDNYKAHGRTSIMSSLKILKPVNLKLDIKDLNYPAEPVYWLIDWLIDWDRISPEVIMY